MKAKTLRKEEKRKKKRKLETMKENKEIEWQTCINRLIPLSPSTSLALYQRQKILLGTSHSGPLPSKWLIFMAGFSLRDYSCWGERFPPWSWSCDIAGHSRLIFLYLFFKLMSYLLIFTIFFTRLFLSLWLSFWLGLSIHFV